MAAHHRVHDYACCHLQADCLEDFRDQLRPLTLDYESGVPLPFLHVFVQHSMWDLDVRQSSRVHGQS